MLEVLCSNCASLLIRVALCLLSALVSGGFSPSSTATSGFSSQGSNTLPCPIPPIAPTSPRSSTGKRRNRKKDHKSSCMTNLTVLLFFFFCSTLKGRFSQITKKLLSSFKDKFSFIFGGDLQIFPLFCPSHLYQ